MTYRARCEGLRKYQVPTRRRINRILSDIVRGRLHLVTIGEATDAGVRFEFRNKACAGIIPDTFIVCGEGGNYCSDLCRMLG